MVQQREEGRGRCIHRVADWCTEDGAEGVRQLAREQEPPPPTSLGVGKIGRSRRSQHCGVEDYATVRGLSAPK